jgi:hypothetical protein
MAESRMKTSEVLALVNIPHYRLDYLVRAGRVSRPARDASGDFIWSADDVECLRRALAASASRRRPEEATRAV